MYDKTTTLYIKQWEGPVLVETQTTLAFLLSSHYGLVMRGPYFLVKGFACPKTWGPCNESETIPRFHFFGFRVQRCVMRFLTPVTPGPSTIFGNMVWPETVKASVELSYYFHFVRSGFGHKSHTVCGRVKAAGL